MDYENKKKYPIYVSKNTLKRHVELLLVGEEGKRLYDLIKDFNRIMHDHTLPRKDNFCRYGLQAFSTAEKTILVIALTLMVKK